MGSVLGEIGESLFDHVLCLHSITITHPENLIKFGVRFRAVLFFTDVQKKSHELTPIGTETCKHWINAIQKLRLLLFQIFLHLIMCWLSRSKKSALPVPQDPQNPEIIFGVVCKRQGECIHG